LTPHFLDRKPLRKEFGPCAVNRFIAVWFDKRMSIGRIGSAGGDGACPASRHSPPVGAPSRRASASWGPPSLPCTRCTGQSVMLACVFFTPTRHAECSFYPLMSAPSGVPLWVALPPSTFGLNAWPLFPNVPRSFPMPGPPTQTITFADRTDENARQCPAGKVR